MKDVVDKDIISCVVVEQRCPGLQAVKYNDTNAQWQSKDANELGLPGWTDVPGRRSQPQRHLGRPGGSVQTNADGEALFDRLEAPKNTGLRGAAVRMVQHGPRCRRAVQRAACRIPDHAGRSGPPAGPVLFGNVEAGGFTITKEVDDQTGLVPT